MDPFYLFVLATKQQSKAFKEQCMAEYPAFFTEASPIDGGIDERMDSLQLEM